MIKKILLFSLLALGIFSSNAMAEVSAEVEYIFNTFSFLACAFLVATMALGFMLLESGLVTTRSVTSIAAKNIGKFAIASIVFFLFGYNLMYMVPEAGYIGVFTPWSDASSIETGYSDASDWLFQALFVCATVSIVSGAVAERFLIWPFFLFAAILAGIIYPIVGAATWGGGWLSALGYYDFAGAMIVHGCGGAAALAGVILLGPRLGRFNEKGELANLTPFLPSSVPLAMTGTFILFFGFYGFNAGSQLALGSFEDATAMSDIFLNTHLAGCGGVLAGAVVSRLVTGKTDILMLGNGALAGLVAITADPLSPAPGLALLIGIVAGVIMFIGSNVMKKFGIDDVVDAVSVHLAAGVFGALVVPLSNPDATFVGQLTGIVSIFVLVFVLSYVVMYIMKATIGLRVSAESEEVGLDRSEVGVDAYSIRD